MAQKLVTFSDIVTAIREAIGVQEADTNAINKIKRLVNMVYLDEILPFKRWNWLEKTMQAVHAAYYGAGNCSVTPGSTTVTLSVAPSGTLGSFKGYRFSIDGNPQVYTVSAHTSGSTTVTLSLAYQETINATANYKIWRDRIDLPTTAKETIEIWHSEQSKPLEAIGSQGLRKLEAASPKMEGFPAYYNTWDFYDPSSGDDEFETDRYRQVRIYPSITQSPVTVNIDYIEEAEELSDDADEPLIPIGDRIVLYYGAGARAWSIISRDEEMADKWEIKFQAKLARMAGEREDGMDTPALSPRSGYINHIRRSGLKKKYVDTVALGGQSSYNSPTYAKDITLEGGTITDDFTVSAGVTIDGRDISEDGALLDQLAAGTIATLVDNTTNGTVYEWTLVDDDVVHLDYSIKRSTDYAAGHIILSTDGTSVAIAENSAEVSSPGVTFSAAIVSGKLRLQYTTTSTGSNATMKWRAFSWLA